MNSQSPRGINAEPLTAWLSENLGLEAPLEFTRIAGGHSNLTYFIDDGTGRRIVLRRPPEGNLLPTAHDMGREHKLISGFWDTDVPVPEALAYCTDESVTGAPFYIMDFVDGVVLHTRDAVEENFPEDVRSTIGHSFIDVLARMHAVDPDDVGFGDLSKKEDYIARQLHTWFKQYEASKTDDDPDIYKVHDWLKANIPDQGPARVVHGDYRLGNTITGADGRIAAVLDWEIATLGDPLADVGYVLATWSQPGDGTAGATVSATSMAPGFPTRAELLEAYASATGADVSNIDYYVAWANWKSACIIQGVYRRYRDGALSTDGVDVEAFRIPVKAGTDAALAAIERIEA